MKVWISRLLFAGALIVALVWGWGLLFPSPEQAIRKQLKEVAELASIKANEAPLARLANAQKLAGYATPDVTIAMQVPGRGEWTIQGRAELAQILTSSRSSINSLRVEFLDVVVSMAQDKESAEVNLTAKGEGSSRSDIGIQELKMTLRKSGGTWLISRVETVRTLS